MNDIIRVEKTKNFTIVSNAITKEKGLSARAIGIYFYLMTKPDDWQIRKTELHNHFKEGRGSINTAWEELSEYGYAKSERVKDKQGKFTGWKHSLSEVPINSESKPTARKPISDKPTSVNQRLLNTNVLTKKEKETNIDAVVISLRKLGIKNTKKITDNYSESYINDRIDIANEKSSSNPAGYFIEILDKEVTQELVEPM